MSLHHERMDELAAASRERLMTEIGLLRFEMESDHREDLNQKILAAQQELLAAQQELLAVRDTVFGIAAELGETRACLALKQGQLNAAQQRNRALLATTTWKLGHMLLYPKRVALRLVHQFKR